MVKVSDLFKLKNGVSSSNVIIHDNKVNDDYIPYLRPSNNQQRVVAGYVDKNEVDRKYIFEKDNIHVSADGQGSHSYSYVSIQEFIPSSHVCVLSPKVNMDIRVKQFYAFVITKNRYKFSYGRAPKGDRLANITIPSLDEIPQWVYDTPLPQQPSKEPYHNKELSLNDRQWKWFKYENIFEIKKGKDLCEYSENGIIPLVSASAYNNGIKGYLDKTTEPYPEKSITVASNGSVGEAFYQSEEFYATGDVNVLLPRVGLNKYNALFICTIIKLERFRFNYGYKWGQKKMQKSEIQLPVDDKGNPDWSFMEDYIKSSPCSKNL